MTSHTKQLSESLECSGVIPRRNKNKDLSTNAKFVMYYGTYQQVVDALDADGVPEHKLKGFSFAGSGTCIAMVNKR